MRKGSYVDQIAMPVGGGVDETMPMQVANIGFMLERLGRDCDDLQFVREITENALQAGATTIAWDVDWDYFDQFGVHKLCCIDNGAGMTPDEMRTYINQLSSSTHEQALDGNFGVGAKVAAATRNPAGVVYQSWKDGRGAMIQLWKDPVNDQYGLRQFQRRDGSWGFWSPIADKAKPKEIAEHGTKVILFGRDESHSTVEPPAGAATPSRWISRYLNGRYFRFPEGVEIQAREGWTAETTEKRNLRRTVRGQGRFLDDHHVASGSVSLTDCDVHWWILDEPEKRRTASDLVGGQHVATLYQDELHEMRTGRAGVQRLHQFGVIFGYERVVLYIEPKNGPTRPLSSNTARTQLLLDGQPLPYADWSAEFRAAMPQELQDYMDAVISGAKGEDHHEAISERLKHYQKLFRLSAYRLKPGGKATVSETAINRREDGEDEREKAEPAPRAPRSRREQERTGRLLAAMLADDGDEADPVPPAQQDMPKVQWVSLENGLRTVEYLDDRAAKYLTEVNMIHANADFRGFLDMINYWCNQFGVARDNEFVAQVVHEWFEQALVETVIGCQALQGEKRWPPHEIEKALSEEALTAAVMQRYHVANAIKRALASKMGSLKDRPSEPAAA